MYPLLRMKDLTGKLLILLFFSETISFIQEGYTKSYLCSSGDEIFIDSTNTNFENVCPLEYDLILQRNESTKSDSNSVTKALEKAKTSKEDLPKTLNYKRVVTEAPCSKVRDNQIIRKDVNGQRSGHFGSSRIYMGQETTRREHTKMRSSEERPSFSQERRETGIKRNELIENFTSRRFNNDREYPKTTFPRRIGNKRSSGKLVSSENNSKIRNQNYSRRQSFESRMYHPEKNTKTDKREGRIHRFGNDRRQRENYRELEKEITPTDDVLSIRVTRLKVTRANSNQRDLSLRSARNVRLSISDLRRKDSDMKAERSFTIRTHRSSVNSDLRKNTLSDSLRENLAQYIAIAKNENQQLNLPTARNIRNSKMSITQRYVKSVYSGEVSDMRDSPIGHNHRSKRLNLQESRNTFIARQTRAQKMAEVIFFRSRLQRSKHLETRNKSVRRDYVGIGHLPREENSQTSREVNEIQTTATDNFSRERLVQASSKSSSKSPSNYNRQISTDIRQTRDNYRTLINSNELNISSQRYSTNRISSERSRLRTESLVIDSSKGNEDLGARRNSRVKSALKLKNINTGDSSFSGNVNRAQNRNGFLSRVIRQTDDLKKQQSKIFGQEISKDNREIYSGDEVREIATNARQRKNLESSRYVGNSEYNIQQFSRSRGKINKTMPKEDESSTRPWFGVIQISLAVIILGQLILNEEKNYNRALSMNFLKKLKSY